MSAKAIKRKTKSKAGQGRIRLALKRRASSVFIAGSFNDWQQMPMAPADEGTWAVELDLPPGQYQYRFIADGEWIDDPLATEFIPNIYGGINCIFTVSAPPMEQPPPPADQPAKAD